MVTGKDVPHLHALSCSQLKRKLILIGFSSVQSSAGRTLGAQGGSGLARETRAPPTTKTKIVSRPSALSHGSGLARETKTKPRSKGQVNQTVRIPSTMYARSYSMPNQRTPTTPTNFSIAQEVQFQRTVCTSKVSKCSTVSLQSCLHHHLLLHPPTLAITLPAALQSTPGSSNVTQYVICAKKHKKFSH